VYYIMVYKQKNSTWISASWSRGCLISSKGNIRFPQKFVRRLQVTSDVTERVKDGEAFTVTLHTSTPWTSVVLPRRMLWRPQDVYPALLIIVPPAMPLPPHLLHPPPLPPRRVHPTRLLDLHSSLPQSLRVCPSTGKLHGACAPHRTLL
jgi:hypothetical protein